MEEKYTEIVVVDRARTERAMAEWRSEALSRAREDVAAMVTGSCFLGIEKDPNAAFIVAVMQKQFLILSRESTATVRLFPWIRPTERNVLCIVSVDEKAMSAEGKDALEVLYRVCDDVSERTDPDGRLRCRFALHDVWASYRQRGGTLAEWMRMTYGEPEKGPAPEETP